MLNYVSRPARYLDVTPDVAETTVRQHIAITKAIEKGSAGAAEAAMVEHLEYVLRYSTEIVRAPA